MDYEKRLQEIIGRYGLEHREPIVNHVEKSIIFKWQSIPEEARVAIWGAGEHTTRILMELISFKEKNTVCFIDRNPTLHGKTIKGIPILSPSELLDREIEIVVISSFAYRQEIAVEIRANYPHCRVIDLYDGLQKKHHPFYDHNFYIFYRELLELRSLLTHARGEEKGRLLKRVIIKYLHIRDFSSARKYIEEYIENGYEDAEQLRDFLAELNNLLFQVKKALKARTSSDLAIFVLDSLRAKDIFGQKTNQEMPFLQNLIGKSIVFKNAYSTSTYTAASFISFFTGKMVIDDNLSYNSLIKFDDSSLLQLLQEKGFRFYQYGGIRIIKDREVDESFFHAQGMTERTRFEAISKRIWNYLADLAKADRKPVFSILHLMESHWPFPNGHQKEEVVFDGHPGVDCFKRKKSNSVPVDKLVRIKNSALGYIDEQLAFYMDYLPEDINLVILGDHGQVLGEHEAFWNVFTWYDEAIHVPVIFYNSNIKPKTSDALFSLRNLPAQIIQIIQHGEMLEEDCSYIEVQRDPISNSSFLKDEEFIRELGAKFTQGYKVIRTNNEKYILYDDGSEEFYRIPNEETNLINEPEYAKEIERLRSHLVNKEFPYKKEI